MSAQESCLDERESGDPFFWEETLRVWVGRKIGKDVLRQERLFKESSNTSMRTGEFELALSLETQKSLPAVGVVENLASFWMEIKPVTESV